MSSEVVFDRGWILASIASAISLTLTFVLILALPSPYVSSRPRFVTENTFSEEHKSKKNQKISGYARFKQQKEENGRQKIQCSVQIVVLGDIGRSPRMQYHALSVASHGGIVDIIGYAGSEVHPDILKSPLITITPIPPFPPRYQTNNKLLFLLMAPFKVLWQVWYLYSTLAYRVRPAKWMLIQNPPSIPTLLISRLVCYLRETSLIIDWHNFGYTILALRLGARHPLIRFADWYEGFFSRSATAHFAVTDAMTRVLHTRYGITAHTLHDRPAPIYQPLTPSTRSTVLHSLPVTAPQASAILSRTTALLVSSTSWTADEDFSLLLSALESYAHRRAAAAAASVAAQPPLPSLLAVITGRGPQREHYLAQIAALTAAGRLPGVEVRTAWLSAPDYAALLGAADLGVSLHTSSSGVDLPMKVVDMFGAGLPVAGWGEFEAWGELVKEGENGRGFGSAEGLTQVLIDLFGGDGKELSRLREGAMEEGKRRWDDEWMPVAGKVLELEQAE